MVMLLDNMPLENCIRCLQPLTKANKQSRGYCKNCYAFAYKHNLFDRSIPPEKPIINLTDEQEQILIGSLLGDGEIIKNISTAANFLYSVGRQQSDYEYLKWNYDKFLSFRKNAKIVLFTKIDKRPGWKPYCGCQFKTISAPIFTKFHDTWYPNGLKIIPKNIKLTPLSAAVWFCDDGSFRAKRREGINLQIATHGFDLGSVEYICNELHSFTGEKFLISQDKRNNRDIKGIGYYIRGNKDASMMLMTIIKNNILEMHMERKLDKLSHLM